MAKIEDLIFQIADERLRKALTAEVRELKKRKRFGLVFEEHLPETVRVPNLAVREGDSVAFKAEKANRSWTVQKITGKKVILEQPGATEDAPTATREAQVDELVVVRTFGDPIYPALNPVERVSAGGTERPWHTLINAENFHALQLLLYCYEGQFDVIYADPPYNTGARDWKYNNDYIDRTDAYRHSKWLSMMKRRLLLAKRLLKPDGVMIVTIDENEVHHLAMLLEELFPNALRQMVTIAINPSGVSGDGLSRVEEYAFFCFFGGARPARVHDDFFSNESAQPEVSIGWESLLRRGNTWYREKRKNLCYPVLLDKKTHRIAGAGEPFEGDDESKRPLEIDGKIAAWPVRRDGRLGIWRVDGRALVRLASEGLAYATSEDTDRGTWSFKYLMSGSVKAIRDGKLKVVGVGSRGEAILEASEPANFLPKTMWRRGAHTAGGAGGSQAVTALLGQRDLFSYPKSVYAVRDCLAIAVGQKPDALVLDFFAGSGTTFHATALLNASDGGARRCVLVTNNEVKEDTAKSFEKRGLYPGDAEYERSGVCEAVTWPRCRAVVSGLRPDGEPVEGAHLDGREYSEGFEENIEYFRLGFLDPNDVARGDAFKAILPILWMMAGAFGERQDSKGSTPWFIPKHSPFAVLIKENQFPHFKKELASHSGVHWAFLVTDSEENFNLMRRSLGRRYRCVQLYKNYLENFRLNALDA